MNKARWVVVALLTFTVILCREVYVRLSPLDQVVAVDISKAIGGAVGIMAVGLGLMALLSWIANHWRD